MIGAKTVLGIVTARGGSKGVPGKNMRPVQGKPLIAYTVAAAGASKLLDRTIVSTDSQAIADAAVSAGGEAPFLRPAELATDEASSLAVVRHAMTQVPAHDYVVVLQPTSPLRTTGDIDGAVSACDASGAATCVSVCRTDKHPHWMYSIGEGGRLVPLMEAPRAPRRQNLAPVYVLNGAVFVARWDYLLRGGDFVTGETVAYEMPAERSLDIDSEFDFTILSALMSKTV